MKTEKLSIFISIVLISLLALGAVSAADDTAATDDAPEASIEEVQTIDNTITNDDMSYESSDIIVNTTGDSGDLDKDSKANLASTKLSEGETSSFTNLANNINNAPSYLSLSGNYAYDSTIDGDYVTGIYINKDITINGGGTTTIDGRNVIQVNGIGSNTTLLYIPEGVKTIGSKAFRNCVYLEKVYIPESVENIGEDAFENTQSLNEIIVSVKNENYYVEEKALYSKGGEVVHS